MARSLGFAAEHVWNLRESKLAQSMGRLLGGDGEIVRLIFSPRIAVDVTPNGAEIPCKTMRSDAEKRASSRSSGMSLDILVRAGF